MENIAIMYNPNGGGNRKKFLNRVLTLLGQNNIKFTLFATECLGHVTKLANKINNDAEYSYIVAAGSD
jgi:diacylglycerol kinase family enzyme